MAWPTMLRLVAGGIVAGLVARELYRRVNAIDLHDRVVLITGGSRGLGLAMAKEFAREGASLVICARDEDELERAREDLAGMGCEVLTLTCDVADREQVDMMVRRALAHFGHVDVLVNNAGVITVGPLEAQTPEDFAECMDIMYWGVFHPTWALLPHMRARGFGRIVNITSIGGKVAVPHLAPYTTAKFAAVGFSEVLKAEVAKDGIAVTTVVPGLMRTGSYLNAYFKGQHRAEFGLFSPMSSLPLTSISAEKAARQIVRAARRGDPEITISIQAQLAARFHGLFPGLTADLMGVVNRLLPTAEGADGDRHPGYESTSWVAPSVITTLNDRAAERLNQGVEV
jgi:NAD(P)-dependent dehydrogenase (short-subunit alcohol dehydrogenase family)